MHALTLTVTFILQSYFPCSSLKMAAKANVDSIFRTRSLGVPSIGLPDQYADGRAAKVWELYMGGKSSRTETYKEWFINTFKAKGVKSVADVACGTG